MKWLINILRNIFMGNEKEKIYIELNGIGTHKLEPKDLASAKLSPAFGGFLVLEVADKTGFVHYIEATEKNIAEIASYIKIHMIVRTQSGEFDFQEIDKSQLYYESRKLNRAKFKL